MTDFNNELVKLKVKAGVLDRVNCSDDENKQFASAVKSGSLPDGVYQHTSDGNPVNQFYRVKDGESSMQDIEDYAKLKQMALLEENTKSVVSIKNMVIFFVVLTVLNLLGSLAMVVNLVSAFS